MIKFAVSAMNFYDNDLSTIVVEANTWMDAVVKHPEISSGVFDHLIEQKDFNIENWKQEAFNCDRIFDCIEIE
jgi:hypothetical protein